VFTVSSVQQRVLVLHALQVDADSASSGDVHHLGDACASGEHQSSSQWFKIVSAVAVSSCSGALFPGQQ